MGDNRLQDRAIAAENSPVGGGEKVRDSRAMEWTNEKHISYLNSIEASFVKQLYNSKRGSNDLLGLLSRAKIHTNSPACDPKNQSFGQFKVQRRSCWENLRFESLKSQTENENESLRPCESPWIQHFRSQSTVKELNLTSADQTENNKLVGRSVHLTNRRYVSEATSLKQPPSFCSQEVRKVSIGSITEVSDQNFEDVKDDRGEGMSRRAGKKRPRSAVSPITDQVVPSVNPNSGEGAASVKEIGEECSKTNFGNTSDSFLKDPNPNDPKSDGG